MEQKGKKTETEASKTPLVNATMPLSRTLTLIPSPELDSTGRIAYSNPAAERLFPDLQERGTEPREITIGIIITASPCIRHIHG